jgi:hypothetical protein
MPLRTIAHPKIPIYPEAEGCRIPLSHISQCKDNWCWAACVDMVLKYFKISIDSQCTIAQKGLAIDYPNLPVNCCAGGSSADLCDQPLKTRSITQLWTEAYSRSLNYRNTLNLSNPAKRRLVEEYRQALCQQHPVEFGYLGTPGHVLLLYAWERDSMSGGFKFRLFDPDPDYPQTSMLADEIFIGEYGFLAVTWEIITT